MPELFQFFDWETVIPHIIKMLIAFFIALPIALNREKSTRIMGLRTFPLVAAASCGFILIAISMEGSDATTHARVLQGLISGIGFIGGGAILKNENHVLGTATAASIWSTGAIGAAVALGFLDIAIILGIVTFFVLRFLTPIKEKLDAEEGTTAD